MKSQLGCPSLKKPGPDIDFTTSPVLVHGKGADIVVAGRKDGTTFGFDPNSGRIIWSTRTSEDPNPNAGALGFGLMADGNTIIIPSATTLFPNPGTFSSIPTDDDGLVALDAFTGKRLWAARVTEDCEKGSCTGISFAPIGFPGVAFAGATDGYVRAYDTASGKVLWRFDTAREFTTLNGEVAKGGAIGRNTS